MRSASAHDLIASTGLAPREARALLAQALGVSREALIARPEREVAAAAAAHFRQLCARRAEGEPMAYLLGQREFFGRPFEVNASVLVPRPETEGLIGLALETLAGRVTPAIIDLGTGSGCIGITLALERPDARVWASDVSEAALQVARRNASTLGARVHFLHASWYASELERFDLIACNPPYIAPDDPHLAALGAEPRAALTDGEDGLACLRRVVAGAADHLTDGGALLVEHGHDQGEAVRRLMQQAGLHAVQTYRDLAGLERICLARR